MGFFPVENIDDYITLTSDLSEVMAEWQSDHPEVSTNSWYSVAAYSEKLQELYRGIAGEVGSLYHRGVDKHGVRIAYNFEVPIAKQQVTLSVTRAMFLFDESYLQPWIAEELEGSNADKYSLEDAVLLLFAWEVPELLIDLDKQLEPAGSVQGGETPPVISCGAVLMLPLEEEADGIGDSFLVQFPSDAALAHAATFVASVSPSSGADLDVLQTDDE